MLGLRLEALERPLRLLCLGAHADDIEIGCGGAIMTLIASHPVSCTWVVWSASAERRREAEASAGEILRGASETRIELESFRESYFPDQWAALKERLEDLKAVEPDLILTHHLRDRHQDHATLAALTWQTWRDHLILEYEVPKYDGDLGRPSVFVPLEAGVAQRKLELLARAFPSQAGRQWFDPETFRGLMRLRGVECAAPSGYAEAFHASKVTLG